MGRIIIYTLPKCQQCKIICSYLKELNIPFEERNAQYYAMYLKERGFSSVPIIQLDDELYNVTSISSLKFLLHVKGYLPEE